MRDIRVMHQMTCRCALDGGYIQLPGRDERVVEVDLFIQDTAHPWPRTEALLQVLFQIHAQGALIHISGTPPEVLQLGRHIHATMIGSKEHDVTVLPVKAHIHVLQFQCTRPHAVPQDVRR